MLKKKIIYVDKIQNILNNITLLVEVLGFSRQKIIIIILWHHIHTMHADIVNTCSWQCLALQLNENKLLLVTIIENKESREK